MAVAGRRSAWVGTGAGLVVAAAFLAGSFAQDPPPREAAKDAKAAPEEKPVPENPFPNARPSPDIDMGNGWLNTSGEISLKDLKGKVVLLDFWTYCCINCMHVLPDLEYLEEKYAKELVVIGVHSAKFDNEKDTDAIRQAILRYEIKHPVINDSEMKVWQQFNVSAWPTVVLIDPEGNYLGEASGEGNRELLDTVIGKVVAFHKAKGTLEASPVKFALEHEKVTPTPLRFPGKLVADKVQNRLFISDSNHNRIVITTLSGKLLDVIGTGRSGVKNGGYKVAEFYRPQGMALVGETLYVADTENHLLRAVDLKTKTVSTIAGTGKQGQDRVGGGKGREQGLNSPWDVCWVDGKLYVAMAGPHQIWVYNPTDTTIGRYAGSGREDVRNGDLMNSAFAQPSDLDTNGKVLFGVCSEGSAIRQIPLVPDGEVTTLSGTNDLPRGRSLFEFGDRDGVGSEARLQHPIGLAYHKGLIYVADSYNHKIKTIDPATGQTTTFLGDGEAGLRDEPARFHEPAGLAGVDNKLYVADTNNHVLRVVDLDTKKVSTLAIEGLTAPQKPKATGGETIAAIKVPPQLVTPGDMLNFEIALTLPEGYKLNKQAPPVFKLAEVSPQVLVAADQLDTRIEAAAGEDNVVKAQVPLAAKLGEAGFTFTLTYNYCRDGVGGLCKINTLAWTIPLSVTSEAKDKAIKLASP